ncbi:hypothetical protein PBY51_003630 [Eleginops maclovinus]|uniref:Uncharacterized protein n=1 Tax=Eleginops maclovinus TaxID=56733 RepID=A0AAN7XV90_ELEMC|nr:hypothetical protein PBY51_003630 [Eleginops maclovinus]
MHGHTSSLNLTSLPLRIYADDQEYLTHVTKSSDRPGRHGGGVGPHPLPLSITSLDSCHFQYRALPWYPADRQVPIDSAFSPPFPAQVSRAQTGDSGGSSRSVIRD